MHDFVRNLIAEIPPELIKGSSTTPVASHLFQVNASADKLSTPNAILYHHLVAKLLYLAKRVRPDLLLAVSFLTTRVQHPDVDDYKKLGRCLRYLRDIQHLFLTLEANAIDTIQSWVDA